MLWPTPQRPLLLLSPLLLLLLQLVAVANSQPGVCRNDGYITWNNQTSCTCPDYTDVNTQCGIVCVNAGIARPDGGCDCPAGLRGAHCQPRECVTSIVPVEAQFYQNPQLGVLVAFDSYFNTYGQWKQFGDSFSAALGNTSAGANSVGKSATIWVGLASGNSLTFPPDPDDAPDKFRRSTIFTNSWAKYGGSTLTTSRILNGLVAIGRRSHLVIATRDYLQDWNDTAAVDNVIRAAVAHRIAIHFVVGPHDQADARNNDSYYDRDQYKTMQRIAAITLGQYSTPLHITQNYAPFYDDYVPVLMDLLKTIWPYSATSPRRLIAKGSCDNTLVLPSSSDSFDVYVKTTTPNQATLNDLISSSSATATTNSGRLKHFSFKPSTSSPYLGLSDGSSCEIDVYMPPSPLNIDVATLTDDQLNETDAYSPYFVEGYTTQLVAHVFATSPGGGTPRPIIAYVQGFGALELQSNIATRANCQFDQVLGYISSGCNSTALQPSYLVAILSDHSQEIIPLYCSKKVDGIVPPNTLTARSPVQVPKRDASSPPACPTGSPDVRLETGSRSLGILLLGSPDILDPLVLKNGSLIEALANPPTDDLTAVLGQTGTFYPAIIQADSYLGGSGLGETTVGKFLAELANSAASTTWSSVPSCSNAIDHGGALRILFNLINVVNGQLVLVTNQLIGQLGNPVDIYKQFDQKRIKLHILEIVLSDCAQQQTQNDQAWLELAARSGGTFVRLSDVTQVTPAVVALLPAFYGDSVQVGDIYRQQSNPQLNITTPPFNSYGAREFAFVVKHSNAFDADASYFSVIGLPATVVATKNETTSVGIDLAIYKFALNGTAAGIKISYSTISVIQYYRLLDITANAPIFETTAFAQLSTNSDGTTTCAIVPAPEFGSTFDLVFNATYNSLIDSVDYSIVDALQNKELVSTTRAKTSSSDDFKYESQESIPCRTPNDVLTVTADVRFTNGTRTDKLTRQRSFTCANIGSSCGPNGQMIGGACSCDLGWTGDYCEQPRCLANGTLNTLNQCACTPGHSGQHCQIFNATCSSKASVVNFRSQLSSLIVVAESSDFVNAFLNAAATNPDDVLGALGSFSTLSEIIVLRGSVFGVTVDILDEPNFDQFQGKLQASPSVGVISSSDTLNETFLTTALNLQTTSRSLVLLFLDNYKPPSAISPELRHLLAKNRAELRLFTVGRPPTQEDVLLASLGNSLPIQIDSSSSPSLFDSYVFPLFATDSGSSLGNVVVPALRHSVLGVWSGVNCSQKLSFDLTAVGSVSDAAFSSLYISIQGSGATPPQQICGTSPTPLSLSDSSSIQYYSLSCFPKGTVTFTVDPASTATCGVMIELIGRSQLAYGFSSQSVFSDFEVESSPGPGLNYLVFTAAFDLISDTVNRPTTLVEFTPINRSGEGVTAELAVARSTTSGCSYRWAAAFNCSGTELGYSAKLSASFGVNTTVWRAQRTIVVHCPLSTDTVPCVHGTWDAAKGCVCEANWWDSACDRPLCQHGGTPDGSVCRCKPGATGPFCGESRVVFAIVNQLGSDSIAYGAALGVWKLLSQLIGLGGSTQVALTGDATNAPIIDLISSADQFQANLSTFGFIRTANNSLVDLQGALSRLSGSLAKYDSGANVKTLVYITQTGIQSLSSNADVGKLAGFHFASLVLNYTSNDPSIAASFSKSVWSTVASANTPYTGAVALEKAFGEYDSPIPPPAVRTPSCVSKIRANILLVIDNSNNTAESVAGIRLANQFVHSFARDFSRPNAGDTTPVNVTAMDQNLTLIGAGVYDQGGINAGRIFCSDATRPQINIIGDNATFDSTKLFTTLNTTTCQPTPQFIEACCLRITDPLTRNYMIFLPSRDWVPPATNVSLEIVQQYYQILIQPISLNVSPSSGWRTVVAQGNNSRVFDPLTSRNLDEATRDLWTYMCRDSGLIGDNEEAEPPAPGDFLLAEPRLADAELESYNYDDISSLWQVDSNEPESPNPFAQFRWW